MTTQMIRLALGGVLLFGVAAPPALAANKEHQQMMADIRMLQEQAQQLQLMLSAMTEALKTVSSKLDEQTAINRKAFADQKLLVDNLFGDVRVVREKVDDANVRIGSLSQEVEALRLAIPRLTVTTGTTPETPAGEMPVDPLGASPAPAAPVSPGISPQKLYDNAWSDYTAGQFVLAIQGFETYIKTFPRSEYADDAQLFIGYSYLADGKFKEAAAAFDQVIVNYPSTNAVPDAYFKRGQALERLDQLDAARESYETVVKQFPQSQAAIQAKPNLERLNRPRR